MLSARKLSSSDSGSTAMLGRRVSAIMDPREGVVIRWDPLGTAMCDALVRHNDGHECWHGSSSLRPADDLGPLPSRQAARECADRKALHDLQIIQQKVVDACDPRAPKWPGCEYAKALVGNAVSRALEDVERRLEARC